ncbi:hypothetical protein EYF80_043842 [Liparis tanakae]|uniref:Uncharacterized protein n=1 Tax=Liparis tanakae TaxID=230148 RepID=A0A4Z2FY94_9TELE|nr:hypothetical protein EYF80_043842 [Liparis tanakae]
MEDGPARPRGYSPLGGPQPDRQAPPLRKQPPAPEDGERPVQKGFNRIWDPDHHFLPTYTGYPTPSSSSWGVCKLSQLLQQGVGLALGGLDAVRPDDARGAVPVEHEDQLLSFQLQLLNLGLQAGV